MAEEENTWGSFSDLLQEDRGVSVVSSPPVVSTLSDEQATAPSLSSPPAADSLPPVSSPLVTDRPETVDLLASTPMVKGHTELPHRYTDHLCMVLSPDEQAVYMQLYRLAWGWGKDTCFISNPRLSERSNVPESTMRKAVRKLIGKKLIEILDRKFGSDQEQGIVYRVFRADSPPGTSRPSAVSSLSATTPIKEEVNKDLKGEVRRCAKCKDLSGFLYVDQKDPSKGVLKCSHEAS